MEGVEKKIESLTKDIARLNKDIAGLKGRLDRGDPVVLLCQQLLRIRDQVFDHVRESELLEHLSERDIIKIWVSRKGDSELDEINKAVRKSLSLLNPCLTEDQFRILCFVIKCRNDIAFPFSSSLSLEEEVALVNEVVQSKFVKAVNAYLPKKSAVKDTDLKEVIQRGLAASKSLRINV